MPSAKSVLMLGVVVQSFSIIMIGCSTSSPPEEYIVYDEPDRSAARGDRRVRIVDADLSAVDPEGALMRGLCEEPENKEVTLEGNDCAVSEN